MLSLDFSSLRDAYARNAISPEETVKEVFRRLNANEGDGVWISHVSQDDALARARELQSLPAKARAELPLYGLPFGVKDCIDVAGAATTCACPEFSYVPQRSAAAVEKLLAAGAIYIGKTNLDQFATGLVGTRTPYGTARNPFNAAYIPGGSSSGSAVAVATGTVSFALGTDTGGSGRVPASYTNTVGLKPTIGRISPRGLVNACRSIDCISVYALTGADSMDVLTIAQGYEAQAPFSRKDPGADKMKAAYEPGQLLTIGIPDDRFLEFFDDPDIPGHFQDAIREIERIGGRIERIDYTPFLEVNRMMFFGPLLAERYVSIGAFLEENPGTGNPVVRPIIEGAQSFTAVDSYRMLYRLEEIKRAILPVWKRIDALMVPTIGRLWKIEDIEADPLGPNFNNGYYTNFVNPLDLAAVATPNGFVRDNMPVGVTLIAPAWSDAFLASLADAFSRTRIDFRGAKYPV